MNKSMAMFEVVRRAERAGLVDCPVIIRGEPGSGKKYVAGLIHRQSCRSRGELLIARAENGEAERLLQGGPFATWPQTSGLAAAAGGTVVIDEIAMLSLAGQARLLNVVEGRYGRVPRDAIHDMPDVRVIATTRFDLAESVELGWLREDVPYRLGVVTIHVPPLRERPEDIPELVEHLLAELCAAENKPLLPLAPELMRYAAGNPWPGNVPELRGWLATLLNVQNAPAPTWKHLPASQSESAPERMKGCSNSNWQRWDALPPSRH
ncbi:MAG: sigma 54-interacting transcriptional regulator [Thermoguttaceae bacterium]|jgi:DNA-binding NtrC family response regulator|nr:sigma 54-interacting transcriptional regulator [Thermoguttaceae bacterium]